MLGLPTRLSALALLGLLASACDDAAEEQSDLDLPQLSERSACGDLLLVAADSDATTALFVMVEDGLVDSLAEGYDEIVTGYDVADERVEVRWVTGTNVYAGHCGLDNGLAWQVDDVEQAVSGRVELSLTKQDDAVVLLVELHDLVLADAAGSMEAGAPTRSIPSISLDAVLE